MISPFNPTKNGLQKVNVFQPDFTRWFQPDFTGLFQHDFTRWIQLTMVCKSTNPNIGAQNVFRTIV